MCSSTGGENCTIQPLASSHLSVCIKLVNIKINILRRTVSKISKYIIKSPYVISYSAFLSENYLFVISEQHNSVCYCLYFYSILLHILLFQPSSGAMLVHRRKEEQGNTPHKQWVKIYFQYLHTRGKGYTPLQRHKQKLLKQTRVIGNCV